MWADRFGGVRWRGRRGLMVSFWAAWNMAMDIIVSTEGFVDPVSTLWLARMF